MSDQIKHECGIAFIRLLKPLEYYQVKYGSWRFGINKMYLLMEKQRNRGQDGAGIACIKTDVEPGKKYIFRERSNSSKPIVDIFGRIRKSFTDVDDKNPKLLADPKWAKENLPFAGDLYLGHLRYGTFGRNDIENVHPVMRLNNWKSRNLVMAGNFNLTNVDELFENLVDLGQHPKEFSDTVTILEKVGHFLDVENQKLFDKYDKKKYSNRDISSLIAQNIDVTSILHEASKRWDGGFALAGMIGHGDAFVMRDPSGIRPAFYYSDDEIVVVTSERPVIQTVMNKPFEQIKEIKPGHALIVRKNGQVSEEEILKPRERKSCSFEHIYFSRGSDEEIYKERKKLGEVLVPQILEAVEGDLENTVFSFIPNTAETAFYGLIEGVQKYMLNEKKKEILKLGNAITEKDLDRILNHFPRVEKVAIKDVKLRTFISADTGRDDLVGHVYDITYGTVKKGIDNLVIIDDSIVRGTTLKKSILRILDRLEPKRIVVVSSSPQIRYPDCYGIDMAKLNEFVAFNAAIQLLKDNFKEGVINDVYKKCKAQQHLPKEEIVNSVKEIYKPFTHQEISNKIAEMLRDASVSSEVKIVYQTIENLHDACPNDRGDWYFTGNYPTPGGNKVVVNSFINYIEGRNKRAY
jgi:amidophosphoribosyltransferase